MKNKNMFFVAFGVILLLALGLSYIYSDKYAENSECQKLEIVYKGASETLKYKDVLSAGDVPFTHETKKDNGEMVSKDFSGAPIEAILALANVEIDKVSKLTFVSADNFKVEVTAEEFGQEGNVYIAHTIGSNQIFDMDMAIDPSKVGGKDILDCYNVVIRSDDTSKRVGRYINKIIVE